MNDDDPRRLLALAVQREQFAMVQRQAEHAEALQGRAEVLQQRSAQIIGTARKALAIVLPLLVVLIADVGWLLFR